MPPSPVPREPGPAAPNDHPRHAGAPEPSRHGGPPAQPLCTDEAKPVGAAALCGGGGQGDAIIVRTV